MSGMSGAWGLRGEQCIREAGRDLSRPEKYWVYICVVWCDAAASCCVSHDMPGSRRPLDLNMNVAL